MSSYRTEAVRLNSNRDIYQSGIPLARRQHWTELPGWVTAYVRENTEIGKKDAQNAHVFDLLCKLWQVGEDFGARKEDDDEENEEESCKIFVISESITPKDPNKTNRFINPQGQNLARDMVNVIEFLARNTSPFDPKRLGWLDPHLDQQFHNSKSKDWIVLPVPDMIHWLSNQVPKTAEKLIRHIPRTIPCQVAIFGNLNHSVGNQFSAASMRFSQVWHRGIFLTVTRNAARSNPDGLKKLISKMIARRYDNLEKSHESKQETQLVLWLSLHTYWLLYPAPISGGQSSENISIASIRAFNQILNPDLPCIPILSKDQVDQGIKNILNEGNNSIYLMESDEIIKKMKIPRIELNRQMKILNNIYEFDSLDEDQDEMNSIIEIGMELVKTFWLFRINLIVVDEDELDQLDQNQLPWCQFITFETLFRFMRNKFSG